MWETPLCVLMSPSGSDSALDTNSWAKMGSDLPAGQSAQDACSPVELWEEGMGHIPLVPHFKRVRMVNVSLSEFYLKNKKFRRGSYPLPWAKLAPKQRWACTCMSISSLPKHSHSNYTGAEAGVHPSTIVLSFIPTMSTFSANSSRRRHGTTDKPS